MALGFVADPLIYMGGVVQNTFHSDFESRGFDNLTRP